MFDFEQLSVYRKTLDLNKKIFAFLKAHKNIDFFLQDQLKRASTSILINIAEGVGRFTRADRRHFYVISRGSAFEVAAILQIIFNQYVLSQDDYKSLKSDVEEISKMLFGLIKNVRLKSPLETRTKIGT
jgi:four helix bundle protein